MVHRGPSDRAVFIVLATSVQNRLDITTAAGITPCGDRMVGHTCDHLLRAKFCPALEGREHV